MAQRYITANVGL